MKPTPFDELSFEKVVDALIRLGVLFLLISWCFDILGPFILVSIWGGIIAITAYPLYSGMIRLLGNRRRLATITLALLLLSAIVIPGWLLFDSIYQGINSIRNTLETGGSLIPPPGPETQSWPAFAKPIVEAWELASTHLDEAMHKYSDHVTTVGKWLLGLLGSVGFGLFEFIAATLIACVMLHYTESLSVSMRKLFIKLAGPHGESFYAISIVTIRNVVKGIIGVAVIQTLIVAIGLFAAGIPYAAMWTIACLVLAIAQVGPGLIAVPAIIYMFGNAETWQAVVFTVWMGIALISDNFLKPLLLGRGAPVPMLVVFLGAIGGFILKGFIGLFLGAVMLSLGYKLFESWLNNNEEATLN